MYQNAHIHVHRCLKTRRLNAFFYPFIFHYCTIRAGKFLQQLRPTLQDARYYSRTILQLSFDWPAETKLALLPLISYCLSPLWPDARLVPTGPDEPVVNVAVVTSQNPDYPFPTGAVTGSMRRRLYAWQPMLMSRSGRVSPADGA
jgi:hypothetical protein